MSVLQNFWTRLGHLARLGLVGGLMAIALLVGSLGYWAMHTEYRVLFSGLADNDMAAMVAELDKLKVPYRIGEGGGTLLVPEAAVLKTRLTLMGRDVPLHGAVGFELFNNMEFGASEFVQKVTYQRALQGELTRTIMAIDAVQSVRVHLALPEQALFRKETAKAKASVTLTTKPGKVLGADQVLGIQRLVAASVNDVQPQDVTVIDQHGVSLSRAASGDGEAVADAGAAQLELKRGVESYLTQKASQVLDRLYGRDAFAVSVDAVFTQEQTRVTTEEVLGVRDPESGQSSTGVIVRERQSSRESARETADNGALVNSETEYQTGKRVEQVVSPAGSLKRLNVAVLVRRPLSDAELQRARELVGASVGLDRARGDVITVQSGDAQAAPAPTAMPSTVDDDAPAAAVPVKQTSRHSEMGNEVVLALAVMLGAMLIGMVAWLFGRRGESAPRQQPLSENERSALLKKIQEWVAQDAPSVGR